MRGDAELRLVTDEHGPHVVVTSADRVLFVSDELYRQALEPGRQRYPGDLEVYPDGDIAFGCAGEGLGRLRYRFVEYAPVDRWRVYTRIEDGDPQMITGEKDT